MFVPELRSDEELASAVKSGDVSCFEELFARYKKPILNFIYRYVGSRETAEEVALEVFMRSYKSIDTFDTRRKFSTWIFTIAKNLSKNAIRDRRYFRDVSLDTVIDGGDGSVSLKDIIPDKSADTLADIEGRELTDRADVILGSLPVKYREVIMLCSIQGLTLSEAADVLGCSVATVSLRLEEARSIFVNRLRNEDGKDGPL